MRVACCVVLLTVVLLTAAEPGHVAAAPIGPICVSLAPAPNFFVLFVTSNGGNQFTITGRDIGVGDRPITGTGFLTGTTFKMGLSLFAVSASQPSSVVSAVINTSLGSGQGFARPLDGVNTSFTVAIAPCPPNALQ